MLSTRPGPVTVRHGPSVRTEGLRRPAADVCSAVVANGSVGLRKKVAATAVAEAVHVQVPHLGAVQDLEELAHGAPSKIGAFRIHS
jgi:hypothetical protein